MSHMTRKELKHYIKTKAEDFEIKDFSSVIIQRAKAQPVKVTEPVRELKPSFFRPLTASLITVFAAMIIVLVLANQTGVDPVPDNTVLENMENVVALSTVQATSLIEVMDNELSTSNTTILRFGPQEKNDMIRDELADLSRYLETIEKLYASNDDFEVVDEVKDQAGFGRRMRFRTRDFMDKLSQYEIDYNQTFNPQTNRFSVLGKIKFGTKTYDLEVLGTKGSRTITMTVKKDELNYVLLDFEVIDGKDTYTVELIKNDLSVEKVTISLDQIDDQKVATLTFVEGTSTGTYTFTIFEENLRKIISIHYTLSFDDEVEEADITIRILTLQQVTIYSILVEPEGRASFSFTRGRMTSHMTDDVQSTQLI